MAVILLRPGRRVNGPAGSCRLLVNLVLLLHPPSAMIGSSIGRYRVVSALGAGAMGEVYRAHDEKLDRDVALKVLPAGTLADEASRSRFRREARVLSRLSHPHVAMLLDFDSADGLDFLAMELVTGPTLAEELLRGGPLPAGEVVRLGAQLARGLRAAHEQGVVHRDLKPSNLALTEDGLLKVLDFGVARLVEPETGAGDGETTTTHSALGRIVGSPPYMSPEQVLGKEVDARTDLYSAGAVLYELATGRRPFGDRRGGELADAILHQAPVRPGAVCPSVPAGLEAVILKALEKDRALRHQTASDLLADLERLGRDGTASGTTTRPPDLAVRLPRWRWLTAGVALVACGALAWMARPAPPPRILDVRPITERLSPNPDPQWATDGSRIYYSDLTGSTRRFWQVPLAGGEPTRIPFPYAFGGILGYVRRQSALLMWGTEGYVTGTTTDRRGPNPEHPGDDDPPLFLVTVPTWTARRIGELRATLAAVSPDERQLAIAYGPGRRRIGLASLDGSGLRTLVELPDPPQSLAWAPDGRRLRFTARGPAGHGAEAWIWETTVDGDPPRPLWPGLRGQWSTSGREFVLARGKGGWLSTSRYDLHVVLEGGRLPWTRPAPIPLTSGPMSFWAPGSPDGRTLYTLGELPRGELTRLPSGSATPVPFMGGVSAHYAQPSPDGRWVAWVSHPEGELWRSRRDGTERTRLTPDGMSAFLPRWSPDGRSLVFPALSPGEVSTSIARVPADGGPVEILARPDPGGEGYWDACFLPDGERVLFSRFALGGMLQVDASAPGRVSPVAGGGGLSYPKCSSRGHVFAFGSVWGFEGYFVRWAGRTIWQRVDLAGQLAYPNWARDQESVIGMSAAQQIVRVWLASGRRETLADLGTTPLVASVSVPWMGLDADDTPLVTIDRGTRGFYALEWTGSGR